MLLKSKKEEMIKDLEGAIKNSESLVFVNFHGLKVADETKLRRELREKEVNYKVSRKTLLTRALQGKAEGEIPELIGEIAIAYLPAKALATAGSKDGTIVPREIYNFQKTHKGLLNIIGGIFEGKFLGKEKMMELAMIPSREVLYAQFVNLINSPIQRFAVVLDAIAKSR
jgi:large subunit ribosomal protein L10